MKSKFISVFVVLNVLILSLAFGSTAKQNAEIWEKLDFLLSENENVRTEMLKEKEWRENLGKENKLLKQKMAILQNEIQELIKNHRTIGRRSTGTVIAFHAYLTHSVQTIGVHHTIPFDVEMTDSGGGYNQYISTYSVPETGIYVFTWTITVYNTMCATELMLNANIIGESYPDSEHDSDNDTATEIVVRQVNAGDVVFVRSKRGCNYIRSDDTIRSSFSGWKL